MQYVWNGAQVFSSKWIVLKGGPNNDNAMRFLAFVARPDRRSSSRSSSATRRSIP